MKHEVNTQEVKITDWNAPNVYVKRMFHIKTRS